LYCDFCIYGYLPTQILVHVLEVYFFIVAVLESHGNVGDGGRFADRGGKKRVG
jgi:hypothetical protein